MKSGWVYMIGDEHISERYQTKEDATADGLSVYGEAEWHLECELTVGYFNVFVPYIDTEWLLERIGENGYDSGGEYAVGYLEDVTKEQENELDDELNKVLKMWIEKHKLQANFGTISDDEVIK